MKLAGKTAAITGAAKGMGEAIARLFAEEGANLVLLDVARERLEQSKANCEALGAKVLAFVVDIRDEEALKDCAAKTHEVFPKVDIVINTAGVWETVPTERIDPSKPMSFLNGNHLVWDRFYQINVMGTVNTTKAFLPDMIESGYGKIVNFGSVAGINGIPTMCAYSASKGAIIALTKALAHEMAPHHINVNCISPGSVSTENRGAPISYLGIATPRQMADAALFLASADSDFITGQNLAVDGGRTLSLNCN